MEAYNLELLRVLVAVGGTALAAWQDWKTSFIDDKILFGMLGAGALLTIASLDQQFILHAFLVGGFVLLFGYLLYRQGQLGMGDVILFSALALLVPSQPSMFQNVVKHPFSFGDFASFAPASESLAFSMGLLKNALFFLSIFVVSSFAATVASGLFYASELLKNGRLQPNWLGLAVSAAALAAGGYFLYNAFGPSWTTALFLLLLLSSAFFLSFREQILREVVVKRIRISEVEDEDILAVEMMDKTIVQKYGLGRVLTKPMVKKLREVEKKEGLKYFPVNKVLPRFGPYILLGLLVALVAGDLFSLMLLLTR